MLNRKQVELVLASFLVLFVELAFIRWSGSNVVYLSYFTNFILLGSFLGIGIGFLRSKSKLDMFQYAPIVLLLYIIFILKFQVKIIGSTNQLIYFGQFHDTGLPQWIMLPIIFLMTALVMETFAEGVARRFRTFDSLEAYRFDIIGSILGIVAFSALSFAGTPPVVWFVVIAACYTLLWNRKYPKKILAIIFVLVVGACASYPLSEVAHWSPYYKITLEQNASTQGTYSAQVYVNGIPHQAIESIQERRQREPLYFTPYERVTNKQLNNVLIIGAGNGSDVAIALSEGAKHVDAVEIDPELYQLGKQLHPNHPYQDPRVTVHINDGRAFLESTQQKYDLILFALPDSLTLVSNQSALRLESYLFTSQAMQAASRHLNSNGVFAMYNYYREEWLIDRLAQTLNDTYNRAPCIDQAGGFGKLAVLSDSRNASALHCANNWSPPKHPVKPISDDRPFLYVRTARIPSTYLFTIGLIAIVSLIIVRLFAGSFKKMTKYSDLFFMGAAFFLLETKSIVQFALYFGTTWFVNSLVFAGVLLSVYAAIEVSKRLSISRKIIWPALFVSLALNLLIPSSFILSTSIGLRYVVAALITFIPIFIANLIFAQRFKNIGTSTLAFGVNLLGALIGGLLEYVSIVIGYRALNIVVAVLYALALLFLSRQTTKIVKK